MKYINKTIIGLMIVGGQVMTSCGSDYLDTLPTESVSTETALSTAENAYKALNGIAKTMSTQQYAWSQGCAGENRIFSIYENYPSQDYLYNAFASGWAPIMNLKYSSRNNTSYDAYPWYYYYTIIGQANTIIAHVDDATGEESLKQYDKASALTYRAYAYEKLLHYYAPRWSDSNNGSELGVILRLDESTGALGQSTMAECYDQIYADCEEAIGLFDSCGTEYRSSSEIWIANINVAHAVYARAALAKQDYYTAAKEAKLAREGYALMSNDDYCAGFCKPTSEWIFGSYGDASENNWYWSYGTQFSCNGYYANNTWYGGGAINIELTNEIPDDDIRKSLFLTPDKFPGYDLTNSNNCDQNYGILGEGNDELWSVVYNIISTRHNSYSTSSMAEPYQAGYYYLGGQMKFYVFDTPGVGYLPFIRSSEMVLIEAEAKYFLGDTEGAQGELNELNADRTPNYSCTKTGVDLWNEIINYRRLELWGEGFSFSDFKRWNMDINRTSISDGGNAAPSIATTISASSSGWTWVLPQYETDYNDAFKDTSDDAE